MITRNDNTIEIGNWDMFFNGGPGTQDKIVLHSITDWKKIKSISVIIRNDVDGAYYDFSISNGGNVVAISSGQFDLSQQLTGSIFDSSNFNTATTYNRGWITYSLI